MKIAHLLAVYNNPNHLHRLFRALSSDASTFYIHVNARSEFDDFAYLKDEPNVRFTKEREAVYWGDFSMIEAILVLLREALAAPERFDRFVWLSAAHYPLQSSAYIEDFFREHADDEFLNAVPMPCPEIGKPISRLTTYTPRASASRLPRLTVKALAKVGIIGQRDYRKHLQGLTPYAGDGWWALTREACEYVIDFVEAHPKIVSFYRNTACPDELLFHTILGNSEFKSQLRHTLTYTEWGSDEPHPAFITRDHLHLFESESAVMISDVHGHNEYLFTRKFSDDSEALVCEIDKLIAGREAVGSPAATAQGSLPSTADSYRKRPRSGARVRSPDYRGEGIGGF